MKEHLPKYKEIYNELKNDIILQKYMTDSFLPTETQLMDHYDAGRGTVRHALSMLQKDGFISTRHGSGSVVLPLPSDKRTGKSDRVYRSFDIEYHVDELSEIEITSGAVDVVIAQGNVARELNCQEGTDVFRIQRIWSINGHPHNHMIQYVRTDLAPDLPEFINESTYFYELMEKHAGLRFSGGEEHISACAADFIEANLLGVQVGAALLYTERTAFCEKGPFEYAVFYGNPEYTGYKVEL